MRTTKDGSITLKEYNRIHKWAERNMDKIGRCFYCRQLKKTHWSNIDHEYRQDITEWQEVCNACHIAYDTVHLGVVRRGRPLSQKTIDHLNRYHDIY